MQFKIGTRRIVDMGSTRKGLLFILFILSLILILVVVYTLNPRGQPDTQKETGLFFVTTTPAPTPTPEDFSSYQQTMKPAFASDIEHTIAKGITRYKIEALLLPESLIPPTNPKILASMWVRYTNTESVLLNQVYFRLFPNTPGYNGSMIVTSVFVDNQIVQTTLLSEDSALFVPLHKALDPGQSVEIVLTYEATLPTITGPGNGLYAYDKSILTLAGFYPTIPVFDDQGWHLEIAPHFADATYTDIALYDVTFTVPAEMVIVTSGNIVQTTSNEEGSKTIHALSGPMRDFFIVMSPTYHHLSREVDGTIVTSYFPAGYEQKGQFVLDVGANALAIFSTLFGPYPYREFDLVAAPVPASLGGVEYPGIIALAERYYSGNDQFMEFVTVHEVAHQWWYGLVGSDQVTHPWLDEALTQYAVVDYYEYQYSPERRSEIINEMFTPFEWQLRNTNGNRPVGSTAADFPELLYYPIVYGKGPLFFEALRNQLGDEAYQASLRTYAQQYRYGVVTPQDLLNTFVQVSGQDVEGLYREWILEE